MNEKGIFVSADFERSIVKIALPPFLETAFCGKSKGFSNKINVCPYEKLYVDGHFPHQYTETAKLVSVHNLNSIGYHLYILEDYQNFLITRSKMNLEELQEYLQMNQTLISIKKN